MRFKIVTLLLAFALIVACSSDKDDDSSLQGAVLGTWDVVEFVVDSETASNEAQFGRQIIKALNNIDCSVITLTFNEDLSAEARNAVSAAVASASLGAGGLEVICPSADAFETVANTYTFADGIVSFLNEDGETVKVPVTIKGDEMSVEASDLQLSDFNESGQLIFERR